MRMFSIMTQLPGKLLVGLDIIIFGFFAQPNSRLFLQKKSQIAWKPLLFCRDFSVLEFKATDYTVLVFFGALLLSFTYCSRGLSIGIGTIVWLVASLVEKLGQHVKLSDSNKTPAPTHFVMGIKDKIL